MTLGPWGSATMMIMMVVVVVIWSASQNDPPLYIVTALHPTARTQTKGSLSKLWTANCFSTQLRHPVFEFLQQKSTMPLDQWLHEKALLWIRKAPPPAHTSQYGQPPVTNSTSCSHDETLGCQSCTLNAWLFYCPVANVPNYTTATFNTLTKQPQWVQVTVTS